MSTSVLSALRPVPIIVAVLLVACGDDGASGPPADAGQDARTVMAPEGSCVQPGDEGNEFGIGTFCSPGGNECGAFTLAPICLADAAPDAEEWFCTRLCDETTNCGEDAFCLMESAGAACVPTRCADPDFDAGMDGGTPPDAATEDGGTPADGG